MSYATRRAEPNLVAGRANTQELDEFQPKAMLAEVQSLQPLPAAAKLLNALWNSLALHQIVKHGVRFHVQKQMLD